MYLIFIIFNIKKDLICAKLGFFILNFSNDKYKIIMNTLHIDEYKAKELIKSKMHLINVLK